MTPRQSASLGSALLATAALAVAYYLAARLGHAAGTPPGNHSTVWIPSGLAFAAVLLLGYRVWPGVWLGAFSSHLVCMYNGANLIAVLLESAGIGAGASLAAVVGVFLVRRFAREGRPCERASDVIRFATLGGALSCTITATVGVLSLRISGLTSSQAVTWFTWWLGATIGVVVVAPLITSWAERSTFAWNRARAFELTLMAASVVVVGGAFFNGSLSGQNGHLALALLAIPAILWAAVRFTVRETATTLAVFSGLAIWAVVSGYGPNFAATRDSSLLALQGYIGIIGVMALSFSSDVTHRHRLSQSESKYRNASLQTADHWCITDLDATILEVNPSFERVTGYSAEDLIGQNPSMMKSGMHPPEFYENMWQTILSGEPYRGVVINRKKNGELYHEEKVITPIRNDRGEIVRFLAMGRDITKQKIMEEDRAHKVQELRQMAERLVASEASLLQHTKILESVLNKMSDGVIVANREGEFLMFNDAATRALGIGMEETNPGEWTSLYGCYLPDEVTPYPTDALPLVRAIRGLATDDAEMFIRNPKVEGGAWLNVSGRPLYDEGGELTGGMVCFQDVTDRRRTEQFERKLRANEEEFEVATKIQRKLFPAEAPKLPGLDIGGATHPAVATGGDYFDYIPMPDGSVMLAIGDVSGHGFGPALLMASARSHLRALTRLHLDPAAIMALVNRLIIEDTGETDFITLILVHLDPAGRTIRHCSAGHTTCYLFDSDHGVKKQLESTGLPLGVLADGEYSSSQAEGLASGDTLLLLTDGILEAESADETPYGSERLLETVRRNGHVTASQMVETLYRDVRDHCGAELACEDDITMIVVKVQ